MAKLGDLVVRIGADTRDLNKSLGKVQRKMRSMTSNFTALGQQMTRSITVPILGIGAMAIKSAADLEKMEVSFISLTGGAKQAADMMKQLNEFTANTPFQIDAVATSARQLIASGTKISEVNEQLQFLGDIAATTGQPINEIAAIFSKVNAKGKVELESLNQLAERGIPIFKALSDATGLLPSELGAGRVSVEQFNATLKSFNEEGGLAEGAMDKLSKTATGKFSTALDNLKLAGASLAEDLLPAVNNILDSVIDLAKGFTKLSDKAKNNIIVIASLAASLGPLLLLLPRIVTGVKLIGLAFVTSMPHIVAATVAIAAITLMFIDTSREATGAAKSVNKVQTALEDLSRSQLESEAQVNPGAGVEEIAASMSFAVARVAEANEELARIQEKIAQRGGFTGSARKQIDELKEYKAEFERVINAGERLLNLDKIEPIKIIRPEQMEMLAALPANLIAVQEPIKELQNSTSLLTESLMFTTTAFSNLGKQIGDVFASAIVDGENFVDGLKAMGKAILKTLISEAIAHAITNAASSSNVANQASGGLTIPAFIAAAVGSVKGAFSDIPQLAEGGIAFGRSLVEVGEYSGASGNPEVIAPLSKLKDLISGNSIQVYGRISGDDIVISNDRATRDRNRF